MITLSEISESDIVKVLLEDDEGIEEETLAKVKVNNGQKLYVNYLEATKKLYKDAVIYSFEDSLNEVELESLVEHYDTCLDEMGYQEIDENMWIIVDEVDSECTDSDVYDYSSEENNSFIAPEDVSEWEKPSDHESLDKEWKKWVPKSEGEKHFKNMVDRIETYAKIYKDEMELTQN